MRKTSSSLEHQTIVIPTIAPSAGKGGKARLLITSGPLEGREYLISKLPFTIGSGLSNDLSIAEPTVSRHHCEIRSDGQGGLEIHDLGSTNGTSIEGVKVTSARLSPNTEVQLGHTRMIVPLVQDRPEIVMSAREQFGRSIGRTPAMRHVFHLAEQAMTSTSPVLLLGESGTGKECLAGDIHLSSSRAAEPFITLDCNAYAKNVELAKAELFGSEQAPSALELASNGTLFLDSIDLMPSDLQPLLLRALETRGDIRFIFASKQDLGAMAKRGEFHEALYCALAVIVIEMPALRRRRDDIPLLVRSMAERLGVSQTVLDWCEQPSTLAFLMRYNWPGNIRQLRTLIEKLQSLGRIPADIGAFLEHESKPSESVDASHETMEITSDRPFKDLKNEIIEAFERKYLSDLLARNAQNISQSARIAGIERAYLQRLIRKYGMGN